MCTNVRCNSADMGRSPSPLRVSRAAPGKGAGAGAEVAAAGLPLVVGRLGGVG